MKKLLLLLQGALLISCLSLLPTATFGFSRALLAVHPIQGALFAQSPTEIPEPDFIFDDMALDGDYDDDEPPCTPPGAIKTVFLVSDSTGVTLKSALQKCLTQFDSCDDERFYKLLDHGQGGMCDDGSGRENMCDVQTRTFTFIRSEKNIADIVRKAQEKEALMICTFADSALRAKAQRMAELARVKYIDLLGPTLDGLSKLLNQPILGVPVGVPSDALVQQHKRNLALTDDYFRRIEAVEFTLKADDGQSPWLLPEADVVIVGVSRTGKTPLSVIMSQQHGLKVANVPLVRECPLPSQLFDKDLIDSNRIFCLTIAPAELRKIRATRLENRRVRAVENGRISKNSIDLMNEGETKSDYADRKYVLQDLLNARKLKDENGWTEVEVTGRAVEETASLVVELLNERFHQDNLYR